MSERQKYIPAEPPEAGRYVIWRRGDEMVAWSVARYDAEDGWEHCDWECPFNPCDPEGI